MRLLVDGVFFQLATSGIARVWRSVLSELVEYEDLEIFLLDRGGAPVLPGVNRIPFPSYTATSTAADSRLIETIAREIGADIFASTYYTSPLATPSVLMVYDMIPEVFGFDLSARMWSEKEVAICHARRYVCISENTSSDLRKFYPEIPLNRIKVAYCGVDASNFRPYDQSDIHDIQAELGLTRPYFILVGSREQHKGYKNAKLFFDAVKTITQPDFDILCVGGEPGMQGSFVEGILPQVRVTRVDLTDAQLGCAYAGAEALVFPSLYEGFGMPLIEAMACGCPVITTSLGSLGEVAGDAAELVSGHDPSEMVRALQAVRQTERRKDLIARGLNRSAQFRWSTMAQTLHKSLIEAMEESRSADYRTFSASWTKLREVQAAVDILL